MLCATFSFSLSLLSSFIAVPSSNGLLIRNVCPTSLSLNSPALIQSLHLIAKASPPPQPGEDSNVPSLSSGGKCQVIADDYEVVSLR